ncbi:MauE/DoxX family redox-associated membrane protein [Kitasatospora sp. NPDC094016]|uniref:MauE/DoxX family redox-associated membrane protein n=1 Tax=Kitasatospora sp. NPDC094016 TaxID=3154986 RepID=UPI003319A240
MSGWQVLEAVVRVAVGGVLVAAGLAKLRAGRTSLLRAVLAYDMAGPRLSAMVSRALPATEVAVGAALMLGAATRPMAVAATGLFALFTVVVAVTLLRGKRVPCNCFGFARRSAAVRWSMLARNAVLISAALFVHRLAADHGAGPWSVDGVVGPGGEVRSGLVLAAIGVAVAATARTVARRASG